MTWYFICGGVSGWGGAVGDGDGAASPPVHAASARAKATPTRRTPLERSAGLGGSVARSSPAGVA